MNIPLSWLKEYVDIACDIKTFEERITMSGSKVESVTRPGGVISGVVVGRVVSVAKHPNADKLLVTTVDVGKAALQIVTGAENIFEGALVPVALDGAALADGRVIHAGELRGEVSQGMMCSIEELGYSRQDYPEAPEAGIYIFTEDQPLGADVVPILMLADDVVEFEITSNRPDCFSVVGIARETAATFGLPLKYPEITVKETAAGNADDAVEVEIWNPELCPRYIARVVKNIKIGPSPLWMRHCLIMAGLRPINNIVDITNYVMLELGQPMHAFDIDNIAATPGKRKIIVRNAAEGEVFVTLDGVERKLDGSMLVIADSEKAVAIAGVMGGENSKVTENATAVLFESANFNGTNIRLTSKKLGLRTDASSKYEKGLDPNLALTAVNRAVQLLEILDCGQVCKGMVDCYPRPLGRWSVIYRPERVNALLGTNIPPGQMEEFLRRVGVEASGGVAGVPTFRPDLETEADIAEEVARLYGYEAIETTLASGTPTVGKKTRTQILEDIIKDQMVSLGLCEALHYAFESPKVFDKLKLPQDSLLRATVNIINPLGEDYSVMRTTTLNGMLMSLAANYKRRNSEAALFELSKIYIPKSLPLTELPDESMRLTIGVYGAGAVKWDFYAVKGCCERLFSVLGITGVDYIPSDKEPFMHPGRCAEILCAGQDVGFCGEIHPLVAENYELPKTYVAVIDADFLYKAANMERKYKPVPKFPSIQRDIALLVPENKPVRDLECAIREKGGEFLEKVQLFDVYKGGQVPAGFKSAAYSLAFRALDRTLTDDEVTAVMKDVLTNLEKTCGATLRSKD
ncbi:MAG: phenylalanine--tRNA ligase subunit beta [Clostridiales bacterium]|jgi:phenylalanyl-tRNA synthetase beta chain|nr:phenylalanine--tRNA ligase subunit beta [Clostridiales bacterium]